MAQHNADRTRAQCPRRPRIFLFAQQENDCACDARIRGPVHQGERQQHVRQAGPSDGHNRNGQNDDWKREEHVDQAHDHRIPVAAQKAGDQSAADAEESGQYNSDNANPQRNPRPKDQPRQNVPSELISAQEMCSAGRLEPRVQ